MKVRIALVLALAGTLLALVAAPATAAPAKPGGWLVAGGATVSASTAAGATSLAAVPPSFCYVSVSQPQLGAGLILTASWQLDCRSGANSNRPATDIARTVMEVRIYQGDPTFPEPGTDVGGRRCENTFQPRVGCSTSTRGPIEYGIPYYTKLVVTVFLLDGSSFTGTFKTGATRLT